MLAPIQGFQVSALANLPSIADQRILGNVSGASSTPSALTPAQVATFLNGQTFLAASGSTAAPGFSFSGATTTGWFLAGGEAVLAQEGAAKFATQGAVALRMTGTLLFGFVNGVANSDAVDAGWGRLAAASIRQGDVPGATPIAQTFTLGEASRPGTDTNVGGANGTFRSGLGTGTGASSDLLFQTPTLAGAGSGVQAYATRMTLNDDNVSFGAAALATTATQGYLTMPTCAGTPTGVPANVPTGQVAFVFDTTGNKIWYYDTAWIGVAVA